MQIIKRENESIKREDAHGGSGSRKLYIGDREFSNIQGMTYGWLPVGNKYAWHNHDNVDEVMYCLKGSGKVVDEDGEYEYKEGDLFMYPKNIYHEIINDGDIEAEYIFIRLYNE